MSQCYKIFGNDDILIVDEQTAGRMMQPFEHRFKYCIVLGAQGAEIRQFERLEMGNSKYAIHREKVPGVAQAPLDFKQFVEVFERQYNIDKVDVRKAVRMAIKVVH